jgi:hypothetical protein
MINFAAGVALIGVAGGLVVVLQASRRQIPPPRHSSVHGNNDTDHDYM